MQIDGTRIVEGISIYLSTYKCRKFCFTEINDKTVTQFAVGSVSMYLYMYIYIYIYIVHVYVDIYILIRSTSISVSIYL